MTYAAAKDSFYRGHFPRELRKLEIDGPEPRFPPAAVAYFQREEMVEPGRTIKRTFDDPQLCRVEFGLIGL